MRFSFQGALKGLKMSLLVMIFLFLGFSFIGSSWALEAELIRVFIVAVVAGTILYGFVEGESK